jgi:hypothetical protein
LRRTPSLFAYRIELARNAEKLPSFPRAKERKGAYNQEEEKKAAFRQAASCCTVWPARILL